MTDKNYTHLLIIVDRSYSMMTCATEMRKALDSYFKEQGEVEGKCLVDYIQFDTEYEVAFTDRDVKYAEAVLVPRGSTALLDAVGRGVTDLGVKLARKPEAKRPGLVQVVVVTDGYENASREWTAEKVRELIKEQEAKYSWDFVFLGANMDAQQVGASFGFDPGKSMTYDVNAAHIMTGSLSSYTTNTRAFAAAGASTESVNFTDEDREANSK